MERERERGFFFFLKKKLNLYESDKPSTHLWPFEPDGSMHHISYQVTKSSPKAVHAYSLDRASLSTDLSSPKHYCLPSLLRAPGIVALSSTLLLALKFVFVPAFDANTPLPPGAGLPLCLSYSYFPGSDSYCPGKASIGSPTKWILGR